MRLYIANHLDTVSPICNQTVQLIIAQLIIRVLALIHTRVNKLVAKWEDPELTHFKYHQITFFTGCNSDLDSIFNVV